MPPIRSFLNRYLACMENLIGLTWFLSALRKMTNDGDALISTGCMICTGSNRSPFTGSVYLNLTGLLNVHTLSAAVKVKTLPGFPFCASPFRFGWSTTKLPSCIPFRASGAAKEVYPRESGTSYPVTFWLTARLSVSIHGPSLLPVMTGNRRPACYSPLPLSSYCRPQILIAGR